VIPGGPDPFYDRIRTYWLRWRRLVVPDYCGTGRSSPAGRAGGGFHNRRAVRARPAATRQLFGIRIAWAHVSLAMAQE